MNLKNVCVGFAGRNRGGGVNSAPKKPIDTEKDDTRVQIADVKKFKSELRGAILDEARECSQNEDGTPSKKIDPKVFAQALKSYVQIYPITTPVGDFNKLTTLMEDAHAASYAAEDYLRNPVINSESLGVIDLPFRLRNKKKEGITEIKDKVNETFRFGRESAKGRVIRFDFKDGEQKYVIRRLGENLAFANVYPPDEDGNIHVNYIYNQEGQRRYNGLEIITMQAIAEDCINTKGFIPSFGGVPCEIGNNQFDRRKMYRMLGADIEYMPTFMPSCNETVDVPYARFSKETITRRLNKAAEKDGFLFPETKANFERIKNS